MTIRAISGAERRNRLLFSLIAIHFGITLAVGASWGIPYDLGTFNALSTLFLELLPLFFDAILNLRILHMMLHVRPKHPLQWLVADFKRFVTTPGRIGDGVITLAVLSVFTGAFGYFKEIIPRIMPFSWDPTFEHLDLILHGGVLPQTWMMMVFGNPYVVSLFNFAYQGWFIVMFFMVFLAVFDTEDRDSRTTFLVGFVIAWGLGGNVVATLLSSAGPVYYERLGFGHAYDGLMSTLTAFSHLSPNKSLNVQELLWQGYLGKGEIRGISAMPSMHVASTTVLMLYGYRRGRITGLILTGFWAMISIAAVLLGWHYAVDVYAGAAFGLFSWLVAASLSGDRAFRRARMSQSTK